MAAVAAAPGSEFSAAATAAKISAAAPAAALSSYGHVEGYGGGYSGSGYSGCSRSGSLTFVAAVSGTNGVLLPHIKRFSQLLKCCFSSGHQQRVLIVCVMPFMLFPVFVSGALEGHQETGLCCSECMPLVPCYCCSKQMLLARLTALCRQRVPKG